MKCFVKNSNEYYDAVLTIYQEVLEHDEKEVDLLIEIKDGVTDFSLLQDFLDLIDALQKEFHFTLTTDIQTDIPELQQIANN
jgi:hypothetical protein